MPTEIKQVQTKQDLETFLKFPWKIYVKDGVKDPNWVPPFLPDYRGRLDTKKNPFWDHASGAHFLAYRDNELVGRISAVVDDLHNSHHKEKMGWFGFYESVNDLEVAKALYDTAEKWVKAKGMTALRGPANPCLNDECAFLMDPFDSPPRVMMTYNPPYYLELAEKCGFLKCKDLLAWYLSANIELPERILKIANRVIQRERITIRGLDMGNFKRDVAILKELYNMAWEANWGFVPMTDKEFDFMAANLKQIVWADFIHIAEVDGKPIACNIVLPDINQLLIKLNGELDLMGLVKYVWYGMVKKVVNDTREVAMGIHPDYRRKGIDAIMYLEALKTGKKRKILGGELSWTLEDNELINKGIEAMGGKIIKKYRIYEKNWFKT